MKSVADLTIHLTFVEVVEVGFMPSGEGRKKGVRRLNGRTLGCRKRASVAHSASCLRLPGFLNITKVKARTG
jgi:hypothetical protein